MQSQEHIFGMPEQRPPEQLDGNTDVRERPQRQESAPEEMRERSYEEGYEGYESYTPPHIESEMAQGQKLRPPWQQPRRRGRGLWIVVALLVFFLAFGGAISAGFNGLRNDAYPPQPPMMQQPAQVLNVKDHPHLIITDPGGNVTIHTGAVGQVIVQANNHDDGWRHGRQEAPQVLQPDANDITINTMGREGPFGDRGDTELDVTVPSNADVQINATSGDVNVDGVNGNVVVNGGSGDVNLQNVQGQVTVGTNSGSINIDHASGSLNVTSSSGSIDLGDANMSGKSQLFSDSGTINVNGTLDPAGAYSITTNSGDINVSLPSDSSFTLDAHTNGTFSTDFSTKQVGNGQDPLTVKSETGNITINKN